MSRASVIAIWVGFWFLICVLMDGIAVLMVNSKLGTFVSRFNWFTKPWILLIGISLFFLVEAAFIWIENRLGGEI